MKYELDSPEFLAKLVSRIVIGVFVLAILTAFFSSYTIVSPGNTGVIFNIWTLYGFFDYLIESPGLFHGMQLLAYYFYTLIISLGIGILLVACRLFYFKNERQKKLVLNLSYVLVCVFNLSLFLISIVKNLNP